MPPGWQTDELAEEWIEEGDADASEHGFIHGVSPHKLQSSQDLVSKPSLSPAIIAGTVIVHTAAAVNRNELPLARRAGVLDKDIFSPLKLETMFRTPGPVVNPDDDLMVPQPVVTGYRDQFEFDKDDNKSSFPFTFNQPVPLTPSTGQVIQQSKLRLFQFEYDAYTRDHLSAVVDAIPVESSSKSTTPHQYAHGDCSEYHIHRPAKRIKISMENEDTKPKTRLPRNITNAIRPLTRRAGSWIEAVRENKYNCRNSPLALRSTASSTVNAVESSRSLTTDELALKLREVALISRGVDEGLYDMPKKPFQPPMLLLDRAQARFPSSATTITHIGPDDLCHLPEQVGRMRLDRVAMKWVKRMGEESDDPFRDVESVKESVESGPPVSPLEEQNLEEVPMVKTDAQHPIPRSDQGTQNAPQIHLDSKPEAIPAVLGTPLSMHSMSRLAPTPIRSALKGAGASTPLNTRGVYSDAKQRCVSFSDGLFAGKIRGLHPDESEDDTGGSGFVSLLQREGSLRPSFRTKRITDMLDELYGCTEDEDPTPCGISVQRRVDNGDSLLSSLVSKELAVAASDPANAKSDGRAKDTTFLTECSFEVAHDRLLQCITDVQPFEPHWEELTSIDLSGKALDSLARLKEFLPKIEELIVDSNKLGWLSGIPSGIRFLSAISNQLTSLTSYAHLGQLEYLDISWNRVDSLLQLECLNRLRELKADHNEIVNLNGLIKLTRLRKLSLIGNRLRHIDLSETTWHGLEYLDLSKNVLETVKSLHTLSKVNFVNLDENEIAQLDIGGTMHGLRCLRLSDNRLEGALDVRQLVNVRILHADRNRLRGLVHTEKLKRLETLSLRYQGGHGLVVSAKDVRDVRRLYLSGNAMSGWFLDEPCYNLVYLELADCKLTKIPKDVGRVIPNVRVLNLNYNFVSELDGLEQLRRLRKVSMIGSRLRGARGIVRAVRGMGELEMVDFRMNPCTVSWYVPLLAGESQKGKADADEEKDEWAGLDAKFRRGLPDELYAGRLVYRGMLMEGCERLKMIDGLRVSEGERMKARELLAKVQQPDPNKVKGTI